MAPFHQAPPISTANRQIQHRALPAPAVKAPASSKFSTGTMISQSRARSTEGALSNIPADLSCYATACWNVATGRKRWHKRCRPENATTSLP
jgi:hypothetical protein